MVFRETGLKKGGGRGHNSVEPSLHSGDRGCMAGRRREEHKLGWGAEGVEGGGAGRRLKKVGWGGWRARTHSSVENQTEIEPRQGTSTWFLRQG